MNLYIEKYCICGFLGLALLLSSCKDSAPVPVATLAESARSGARGPAGSSSAPSVEAFTSANSVKVAFNKKSFYNNHFPNSSGCAGDARKYFDPMTDREVPVKPEWLKNIAVELTNSNALYGPSQSSSCSLTGVSAPQAANCASFDDLQPTTGRGSRSILIGGQGCGDPSSSGCYADAMNYDVWALSTSDISTSISWSKQTTSLALTNPVTANVSRSIAWAGGDYDPLHDQYYLYGGVNYGVVGGVASTRGFSDQIIKIQFGADGSAETTATIPVPSSRQYYAGWAKPDGAKAFYSALSDPTADEAGASQFAPRPLAGPTFTFGLRRDATFKSYCKEGDVLTGSGPAQNCESSEFGSLDRALVATNEHSDYFLLLGGLKNSDGLFSNRVYLYKPHGLSNDIGDGNTTTFETGREGDWTLLSNVTNPAHSTDVSNEVMSIVDISYDSSQTYPFVPTFVGGQRPAALGGDTFRGWLGRGFHRTVYDPAMNRFYIFGGLQNDGASAGAPVSAVTGVGAPATPDLAANDVWIYDPPALGRRPTAGCFTRFTPDLETLPANTGSGTNLGVMGAYLNLGVNRNYTSAPFVFPPGGCLQRIQHTTAPEARFEHSMAFDRDHRAMVVFGGCKTPNLISAATGLFDLTGDPTTSCNSSSALLSDTWLYLPPTTTEFVSKDYRTTAVSPYNASTLLANVFGIDPWLDRLPIYSASNNPSYPALTQPESHQVLGTWVRMYPPGDKPSPRVGGSLVYDRGRGKFYLFGGYGCTNTSCTGSPTTQALNDLWEYTPPEIESECDRSSGVCIRADGAYSYGSWRQIRANNVASNGLQPSVRRGATMAYAQPTFSYGDDFYTVTDTACFNQGPISTGDSAVNKKHVGAIYIDVDRNELDSSENLLVHLRLLPFDENTRLPALYNNNTTYTTFDDTDAASTTDSAKIHVQLLSSAVRFIDQIFSLIQPRYHEFLSGTPIVADSFTYIAGANGQITEKQILIPLKIDSSINLIKIERIEGSVKFYEMTVSKF
ncbi:MAG: hypothetical protein AB1540_12635 [Bdellovibrionota bacterium]